MVEETKYMRTLVENAQRGKLVAMEELYGIHLNQVHTLVSRLAGNKLIAEQLTENILVRAWERINIEGPGEMLFSDWIRELAVQLTVNELKDPTLIEDKKFKKQLKKNIQDADYSSDPSEKIVAELDLDQRIIFVLNRVENYSLVKVSNFMGLNESEAEAKLSESMKQIFQALSKVNKEQNSKLDWLNLQQVIEPDEYIINQALEEIKEIRTAEVEEEEVLIEAKRKEENKELEKAIEKERKEKVKEKTKKVKRNWGDIFPDLNINIKLVLGGIIFLIVIFLLVQFTSSSDNWSVSISKGTPFINEKPVERSGVLAIEDVITTDELSSASIEIPEIGIIEMSKNSKLTRPNTESTLEIIMGGININAENATARLTLKVPDAIVQELDAGTSYSVQVDSKGNSTIRPENGWLQVSSKSDKVIFPEQYILNIYKNSGIGIPYHLSSSVEYSALLDKYLFGGKRDRVLKNILSVSSKNESISLWNLLSRVDAGHQVENVYYRLVELAPHSEAVTKADVLLLNPNILNKWFEEIKRNYDF